MENNQDVDKKSGQTQNIKMRLKPIREAIYIEPNRSRMPIRHKINKLVNVKRCDDNLKELGNLQSIKL